MNALKTLTAALALAGLSSAALASGSLVLSPANSAVDVGAVFAVQVRGASFTDNVIGGGFDFSFSRTVLRLDSVVVNTAVWDFATSPGTISNAAGTLSNTFFNAFSTLPTGNFAIATLNFTAMAAGNSPLSLFANGSFPFANDLVEVIDVSYGNGLVTVGAVPEPSTWASLALGLALLPMLRRRLTQA